MTERAVRARVEPHPSRHSQTICHADLAHLVERHLAKVEVAGSSPVIRSIEALRKKCFYFFGTRLERVRDPFESHSRETSPAQDYG